MWTPLKKFCRVSRANYLPVSLLPYAVGGLFAMSPVRFDFVRFLLGGVGVAAVHLAANLLNDYWDYKKGADGGRDGYSAHFGGSQAIQDGAVSAKFVWASGWCLMLFSLLLSACGSFLLKTPVIFILVAAGALAGWAYTAGPFSLAYRGLGESALFIAFGPLLVAGGYFLQTLSVGWPILLLSLPSGLLVASVLLANEAADEKHDRRTGKFTLAVRLGGRGIVVIVALCLALACVIPAAGVYLAGFPVLFALSPAIIPLAGAAVARLRKAVLKGDGYDGSSRAVRRVCAAYHFMIIAVILIG